jgi:aspartate racemase
MIGILGGIGVEAGIEFSKRLYNLTQEKLEKDNIKFLLYNNPTIPDRTESIINNNLNVLFEETLKSCKLLENAGCNCIVMVCNTIHVIYDDIANNINIPIIDITKSIKTKNDITLLSTKGTYISNIYKDVKYPEENIKQECMNLIYETKNDIMKYNLFNYICSEKKKKKIILGCTELSLYKEHNKYNHIFLDPMDETIKIIKKKFI